MNYNINIREYKQMDNLIMYKQLKEYKHSGIRIHDASK